MKNLFGSIQYMAENVESAIVLYSLGKDSTVMLDLFQKYMPGRFQAVFLYYCDNLESKNKVIKYYEDRYKIKIDQYPHFETSYLLSREGKKVKRLRMADTFALLRQKYGIEWIALGWEACESMARAMTLKTFDRGIDWKYKKLCPLHLWGKKDIDWYIAKERLILAPETYDGFRNIDIYKGSALEWLKLNYPNDFERWCTKYPSARADYLRWVEYGK
jgi:3'-phosphoadenosine 5'-phosphosulfate sulfotransferase (PAPS reductase)/FAD synthetase